MGQYNKALPLIRECVANTKNLLGKNHPKYAIRLNNLGGLLKDMGQYDKALPLYLEALETTEKSAGKNDPAYGIRLNNLGHLYQKMGQYDKSIMLLLEAIDHAEKILGKDHPYYGERLNNLALLYQELGQYDKAVILFSEALDNTKKSTGAKSSGYGIILDNLAILYRDMGQYDKALSFSVEAVDIIENSLGKEHPSHWISLSNMATIYSRLGEFAKALPIFNEVKENLLKNLGEAHPLYGGTLGSSARVHYDFGQYEEALLLYSEALQNIEKNSGKEQQRYGIILNSLARVYQRTGQQDKALEMTLQANSNLHQRIVSIFPYLNEAEKTNFLASVQNQFDGYHSFAYTVKNQYPDLAGLNYSNALTLKNLVLSGSRSFLENISNMPDTAAAFKANQWHDTRRQLAQQYSLPIAKRWVNVDSLEKLADELEGELVRSSAEFTQATRRIEWQDVQTTLAANEAAIEFVHFRYYDPDPTDSTFYAAMLLRPGYEYPKYVFLFEERQLKQRMQKGASDNDKTFITRAYGDTALYNLVWKPIDSLLEGADKIYYALSGMLHSVSFAAIPAGRHEYLSQRYDLVQLSTTRTIPTEMPQPQYASITTFGGIDYAYDPTGKESQFDKPLLALNEVPGYEQVRSSDGGWSFLPGSAEEVKAIAGLFKGTKTTSAMKTGAEATEADFKALSGNSPKVLHISTHGFFFPDIEKSKDDLMRSGQATFKYMENPLFRSGLAFAGGNYALMHGYNPHEREDGILTAYEISNMDLSNTDLVVLSACETGLGEIKGSEGVYGLQRAFQMAGVEYIIMSLWRIPDKQTKILMERFYSNWLGGMNIRKAFREAQQHMSKTYDPFYWAGFVLVGGGKDVGYEGGSNKKYYYIFGALALVVFIPAAIYFRSR